MASVVCDAFVACQCKSELTEANTFANMRKVAEASEMRFQESSPFLDQAKFFSSVWDIK